MVHCSAVDCLADAYCRGLCKRHYFRDRTAQKKAGTFESRYRASITRLCEQCGRGVRVQANQADRGEGRFCSYECKYEAARGVERVPGSRYVRGDGYVAVKVGIRQYQLEHRLVMEQVLGRTLDTDEHVHHINGVKGDNRIANLRVMTNEEHQRLHDHLGVQFGPVLIDVICQSCSASYRVKPSRAATSKFCSNSCRLAALHAGNRKP